MIRILKFQIYWVLIISKCPYLKIPYAQNSWPILFFFNFIRCHDDMIVSLARIPCLRCHYGASESNWVHILLSFFFVKHYSFFTIGIIWASLYKSSTRTVIPYCHIFTPSHVSSINFAFFPSFTSHCWNSHKVSDVIESRLNDILWPCQLSFRDIEK